MVDICPIAPSWFLWLLMFVIGFMVGMAVEFIYLEKQKKKKEELKESAQ